MENFIVALIRLGLTCLVSGAYFWALYYIWT